MIFFFKFLCVPLLWIQLTPVANAFNDRSQWHKVKWTTRYMNSVQAFILQDSIEKQKNQTKSSQTTNFSKVDTFFWWFSCETQTKQVHCTALDVHPFNMDTAIEPFLFFVRFVSSWIIIIMKCCLSHSQRICQCMKFIRTKEKKETCWCAIGSARLNQKYTHWNPKFDETFWYYIESRV